jgi:hypothetical protein
MSAPITESQPFRELEDRPVLVGNAKLKCGIDDIDRQRDEADFSAFDALQIDQRPLRRYFDRQHAALIFEARQSGGKQQFATAGPIPRLPAMVSESSPLCSLLSDAFGDPECSPMSRVHDFTVKI